MFELPCIERTGHGVQKERDGQVNESMIKYMMVLARLRTPDSKLKRMDNQFLRGALYLTHPALSQDRVHDKHVS